MSSTENKTTAVIDALIAKIVEHEHAADSAMQILEKFNTTAEDYKKANFDFGVNNYVAGYLRHLMNTVGESGIEYGERRIRFHAYKQREKVNLENEAEDITVGMRIVADFLYDLISKFFED